MNTLFPRPIRRILTGSIAALAATTLAASFAAPSAQAAVIFWDGVGGTANDWASVANWSTVAGGGTNPVAIPGAADIARFSATSVAATQTVNLNADRSVLGQWHREL